MVTGLSGGPGFLLVNRQPQFHRIPTPSVCLSTVNLSPSPRSNHWSPGSSIHPPPALADTHVRLGSAGRRHHPCSYPSAVAATNRLPCSPLRLRGSPSVPATLRGGEGASLGTGTFLLSQLSRRGTASDPTPPLFFFSNVFSYPVTWRFSWSFSSLRSSSSVQQIFCEGRSTYRCIFDIFLGEGELYVLLLCHLDHSLILLSFILPLSLFFRGLRCQPMESKTSSRFKSTAK